MPYGRRRPAPVSLAGLQGIAHFQDSPEYGAFPHPRGAPGLWDPGFPEVAKWRPRNPAPDSRHVVPPMAGSRVKFDPDLKTGSAESLEQGDRERSLDQSLRRDWSRLRSRSPCSSDSAEPVFKSGSNLTRDPAMGGTTCLESGAGFRGRHLATSGNPGSHSPGAPLGCGNAPYSGLS